MARQGELPLARHVSLSLSLCRWFPTLSCVPFLSPLTCSSPAGFCFATFLFRCVGVSRAVGSMQHLAPASQLDIRASQPTNICPVFP